jgi:hypothetical protein
MADAAAADLELEGIVDMPLYTLVDTIFAQFGPGGHLGFLAVRVKLDRIARELRLDRESMCLEDFLVAALGKFNQPRSNNAWHEVDRLVYILDELFGHGGHQGFLAVRVKLDRIARELRLDRESMCLDDFLAAALGKFGQPRGNNVQNEVEQLVYILDELAYIA